MSSAVCGSVTSWLKSLARAAATIGATLLEPAATAITVGMLFERLDVTAISRSLPANTTGWPARSKKREHSHPTASINLATSR